MNAFWRFSLSPCGPKSRAIGTRRLVVALTCVVAASSAIGVPPADLPPTIPFGADAITQWEQWPYLRIGVRAYMRSTFDRTGGNFYADAAHYLRQTDDGLSVALDERGPGILWFVRHNHWHGSPWHYRVDGQETIVTESSTADPVHPVENSVYEPQALFPKGLTYTWSVTKGADLSWVPIPFEESMRIDYGRTMYGTGYFMLWKVLPGIKHLSQPLESWSQRPQPTEKMLEVIGRAGTDIAPEGPEVSRHEGTLSLAPYEARTVWRSNFGPTMIRRISFTVPEQHAADFAKARLRITWDDRREPSVDAPVSLFFGTGSLLRDEGQEYIVKSFPMTVKFDEGGFLFATYFPMPFQRSARFEITSTTGAPIEGVEWQVRSTPFADPPNHVGYFHATYRDFPNPEAGKDLELLDTRTVEGGGPWCGHVVGTTYIFTQRGNLGTLEGDPRYYLDDSLSPQGQATGSEEWGGGGDYWGGRRMTLPFAGHPVGKPNRESRNDLDRIHSAYRFLLSDLIPFGRNARFTLEHGGRNDSTEHYETVTYWYGLDEPALVLTDEFDVGNEDDEKLHAYNSPQATSAETLASRFEVGVDHVPLAGKRRAQVVPTLSDDGRRTVGTSEMTFAIDPHNIGVMLRRRLDLEYPNQRARVFVAAADDKEPKWEPAGIWYTAGSNTCVFGDPRELPESERTGHVEVAAPASIPKTSNRRWRDDEFLLPVELTRHRDRIRVKFEFDPLEAPLFPGHELAEEAWTEYRYWAYSFVMPKP
jgi:hypothetical protein